MAAPGNLGLYDQIAALRWVKRNIQNFGGNNDDITLLGHDAGAISGGLLLLAPHETQGKCAAFLEERDNSSPDFGWPLGRPKCQKSDSELGRE